MKNKTKSNSKSNYYLNREDQRIMSLCLKHGYKVFVTFLPTQAWVRYDPLVTLSGTYKGKIWQLIDKPFDQRYITYYTIVFYKKFYKKQILKEIEVVAEEVSSAPPPPPDEVFETKPMFAPPPPED